jgi:hypothetical protein
MALKDIPPDAPGVPWAVWHEQQIERIFAEARARRERSGTEANRQSSNDSAALQPTSASARTTDDTLLEISPYDE